MHWIDERISELKDRGSRRHTLEIESPRIYDALWSYIIEDIKHANSTDGGRLSGITTSGNASLRKLTVTSPSRERDNQIHVELKKDEHTIVVTGKIRAKFSIRFCPDGSVCLQDEDGKRIEFAAASRKILDPFLFPDLQKPEFPASR